LEHKLYHKVSRGVKADALGSLCWSLL